MAVISLLDVRVTPDSVDSAAAVIHETLEATRTRPGCLGVEVLLDVDDPAHYVFVERWESIEADDAYRAWRSTPEGASPLRGIVAEPPVLTRGLQRDDI